MRWIAVAVLLCGCDALFQIDHLKQPPDDGHATDAATQSDGMLVDAPKDATGRTRVAQTAQLLLDGQTLSLVLPSPQVAGDLNVLCVSWVGSSGALSSVADEQGNSWINSAGTGSSASTNQSLYYAYNIKAGTNRITVTFNASVSMVNMRFVEYANVLAGDPKIGANVAVGNSATMTSATITVNQKALIIGGFVSSFTGIAPGPNFTERIEQTFGYLEDREVTASGGYAATAMQSNTGAYIAHIAVFAVL
jgi:hypothetical protein